MNKLLALLMIYLIISLIFSTAFVFAAVYKAEAYGQDDIPGTIRGDDTLTVRTESAIACKVRGSFNNNTYEAMSCNSGTPVVCTYSTTVVNISDRVTATIKEDISDDTATAEAYVDNLGPVVNSLSSSSLGNKAKAAYTITDQGNVYFPNTCSGIEKVDFFIDGSLVNTTSHPKGECNVNSFLTGTKPGFSGRVNTSIKVYDYMGLAANRTGAKVSIDTLPPMVASTVNVTKAGTNQKIDMVALNTTIVIDVDVKIVIDDSGIAAAGSVFANFSRFDITQSVDQTNKEAGCVRKGWEKRYICTFSGVKLNLDTTSPAFLVRVTDLAGNTVNESMTASFSEHTGATIGSAKVYRTGTRDEILTISTQSSLTRNVDVVAELSDKVKVTEVTGDFKELDKAGGQTDVASTCAESYDPTSEMYNYNCTFAGVKLNPKDGNPKIKIKASDELGKVVEQEISLSFNVVNDAGTVSEVGPEKFRCNGGVCYVKAGLNNITALITTSSSYNDSKVYIQGAKATCRMETAWACQANANFKASDTKIIVTGTDDLGNPLTGEGDIVVDDKPPELKGKINTTHKCPTAADTDFQITLNATEDKSPVVIIKADVSEISTDNESKNSCAEVGMNSSKKMWQCALPVVNIEDKEINTKLNVVVEDLAGNQLVNPVNISICIDVEEVPDLIDRITTRGQLPKVDRRVASKITVKLPLGLGIRRKENNVEIIERSTVDCSNTPGIKGSAHMMNDNSLKPILVLPLEYSSKWDKDDKVHVNCTQEFKIKHGNKLYRRYPEVEAITFELEVYNQPLGTITDNYQRIIKEKKDRLSELDDQINKWNKIDSTLGWVCDFAEKLSNVNSIVQSAKSVIYAALAVLVAISAGIFTPIADAIWPPLQKAAGGLDNIVQMFIWPVGWVPTGGNTFGLIVKGTCAIYTCKFYDFSTYLDIGMSIAAHKVQEAQKREAAEEAEEEFKKKFEEEAEAYMKKQSEDLEKDLLEDLQAIEKDLDGERTYTDVQKVDVIEGEYVEPTLIAHYKVPGSTETFYHILDGSNIRISQFVAISKTLSNPQLTDMASEQMYEGFNLFLTSARGSSLSFSSEYKPNTLALDHAMEEFVRSSGGTWIVNPYKSTHYDDLCIPAILFNDQKEKYLTCRYVECMKGMGTQSGAIEACDFEYQLGTCLYLDSAQYRLQPSVWKSISEGVISAMLNSLVGVGVTVFYLFGVPNAAGPPGCINYQFPGGDLPDIEFITGGLHSAVCGTMGTLLAANELDEFFDNKFRFKDTSPTDLPGPDFCAGVSYE